MEATKKKKAYLKPEMNRFEMKTQEFIAISGQIIEDNTGEVVHMITLGDKSCFSQYTNVGTSENISVNDCFQLNSSMKGCTIPDENAPNGHKNMYDYLVTELRFIPGAFYKITAIDGDKISCMQVPNC